MPFKFLNMNIWSLHRSN